MSCMLMLKLRSLSKYLAAWCWRWCWYWCWCWRWYQADFGTKDKCAQTHNVITHAQVEGMTANLMSMLVRFLAGGNLSLHLHIWKTIFWNIFWKEKNWEIKLAGGEKATLVAASSKTGTHSSQGADISQFTVNIRKSHSLHFIVPQLFAS